MIQLLLWYYDIGDSVFYDGECYKIEGHRCSGVYFIGNSESFVDLVPLQQIEGIYFR